LDYLLNIYIILHRLVMLLAYFIIYPVLMRPKYCSTQDFYMLLLVLGCFLHLDRKYAEDMAHLPFFWFIYLEEFAAIWQALFILQS